MSEANSAFQVGAVQTPRVGVRFAHLSLHFNNVDTCHRLFAADNAGLWLLRDYGQVELVTHRGNIYPSLSVRDLPTVTPVEIAPGDIVGQQPGGRQQHTNMPIDKKNITTHARTRERESSSARVA